MTFQLALCDDEEAIRFVLHKCLMEITGEEGINVHIDEFNNPQKLLTKVQNDPLSYHLIFLDIDMPQMNGIDAGKKLKEYNQDLFIIYITAYDQYALHAFEVGAENYLLKPLNKNKLRKSLLKSIKTITKLYDSNQFIMILDSGNYVKIYYRDILYFEKYKNKIRVICKNNEYNPYMTFKDLKEIIDEDVFVQCHRGIIVHKDKITGFEENDMLIIDKEYEVPVSMSRRKEIKRIFYQLLRGK